MTDYNSTSSAGKAYPLGATITPEGVNFSVYSKSSTELHLLLFDSSEDPEPSSVIALHPKRNRTFHYWHVFVPGIGNGQVYAYRAFGPYYPEAGLRFNPNKLLIDPYGRAVAVPDRYDRSAGQKRGDNVACAMRSVVADCSSYDWEGDTPLRTPFVRTIIYEMHVRGFTQNKNSGVSSKKRGTYAGLIDKIPYLQDLGVTAVELLPVFQFDAQEAPPGKTNYWGYNPVSFFAPHHAYSSNKEPLGPIDEFRDMVKALHKAGIEVILDVVYNHTAEGDHRGPTFCFKGFENHSYYILDQNRSRYANYSGTGNTLNANRPIVRRMILDSLHYWVEEMHVDGFRFDLASILSRDEEGVPLANPPILYDIETDPILAGTKLIAEAWDAAGLYQVGSFAGDHWKEWNGHFRDDVRAFIKGDRGKAEEVAARFLASPDLYGQQDREPEQSINFVTCHDGFTLNDVVSYNDKHNLANGEHNRDGSSYNLSWNCGIEGPTNDPEVEKLRNRQVKNFFVVTLGALGVPMLTMGDEVRRTQEGNNNAYCQDNEISWFDWSLLDKHADIYRFVKRLLRLRKNLDIFSNENGFSLSELLELARVQWHGVELNEPDWSADSHWLSFTVRGRRFSFQVIVNAYWEAQEFSLPQLYDKHNGRWRRIVDTYLESPDDFCEMASAPKLLCDKYVVQPRTIVILAAEKV